jgi:hypothetical protein
VGGSLPFPFFFAFSAIATNKIKSLETNKKRRPSAKRFRRLFWFVSKGSIVCVGDVRIAAFSKRFKQESATAATTLSGIVNKTIKSLESNKKRPFLVRFQGFDLNVGDGRKGAVAKRLKQEKAQRKGGRKMKNGRKEGRKEGRQMMEGR